MTDIYLHGQIAQEFGPHFRMAIGRAKDAVEAIDCVREGFESTLKQLAQKGLYYSVIADGKVLTNVEEFNGKSKIERIDIVPTIAGAGIAALAVGAVAVAGAFAVGTSTLIGGVLLAVGLSALSFGLQSLLIKPPKPNAISQANAQATATSKSFLFSSRENLTLQGNPIPLGYGRLRIGSSVVQQTFKSYPNSTTTFDEFVSQSTQQGEGQMSVIQNQNQ